MQYQYNINDFLVLTSSSFRQELVPAMDSVEMPGVSSAVGQEDTEDLSIPRAAINKMIKGLKTLFLSHGVQEQEILVSSYFLLAI